MFTTYRPFFGERDGCNGQIREEVKRGYYPYSSFLKEREGQNGQIREEVIAEALLPTKEAGQYDLRSLPEKVSRDNIDAKAEALLPTREAGQCVRRSLQGMGERW